MVFPIGPGTILAGKYRIGRKLGEGGMGVVFAATHMTLEKPRAIKLLRTEIATNTEAVRRFLREGRAASELESRHVARVYDVERLPSGEPYLVMEYLEGADLASVLAAHGPLPAAEAALYVRQACDALAEAHARGLVHRDVKPANLFLAKREGGTPAIKVLDFGIAKAAEPTPGAATAAGAFLGTLQYCAPEQIECSASVDARADLWALGVVLYELVTGAQPFNGSSAARLVAQVTESAPATPSERIDGLPAGFDELVLRCLEKDRERRFATAGELSEALRPFAPQGDAPAVDRLSTTAPSRASRGTLTAHAPAPPTPPMAVEAPGRSPVVWGATASILVAITIVIIFARANASHVPTIFAAPPALTSAPMAPSVSPAPEPSSSVTPSPPGSTSAPPARATALRSSSRPGGAIPAPIKPDVLPPPPQGPIDGGTGVSPPGKPRYDIDGNLLSE